MYCNCRCYNLINAIHQCCTVYERKTGVYPNGLAKRNKRCTAHVVPDAKPAENAQLNTQTYAADAMENPQLKDWRRLLYSRTIGLFLVIL